MFLPLLPPTLSFTLPSHARSVSPSARPPGLWVAHVTPWAARAWNIDVPRRGPPPAHSAGGTDQDCRQAESEWVNFSKEDGYAEADGGTVEWSKWGELIAYECVFVKKHVIPAASWPLHTHPVIHFQVIWSFIQRDAGVVDLFFSLHRVFTKHVSPRLALTQA